MNKIYLHLGSNVGDRKKILDDALTTIDRSIGNIKSKSSVYETEPWGLKDQENFLNLYYNDDIVKTDKITIPHASLYQRNFVLIPLMEIAGDLIDPVEGKTIEELYDECHDECEVFIFED